MRLAGQTLGAPSQQPVLWGPEHGRQSGGRGMEVNKDDRDDDG